MAHQNDGPPKIPMTPDQQRLASKPWQNNPTLGPAFINGAQVRDLTPEELVLFKKSFREGLRKDLERLPEQLAELIFPHASPTNNCADSSLTEDTPPMKSCKGSIDLKNSQPIMRRIFKNIIELGHRTFQEAVQFLRSLESQNSDVKMFLADKYVQEMAETMWDIYAEENKTISPRNGTTIRELLREAPAEGPPCANMHLQRLIETLSHLDLGAGSDLLQQADPVNGYSCSWGETMTEDSNHNSISWLPTMVVEAYLNTGITLEELKCLCNSPGVVQLDPDYGILDSRNDIATKIICSYLQKMAISNNCEYSFVILWHKGIEAISQLCNDDGKAANTVVIKVLRKINQYFINALGGWQRHMLIRMTGHKTGILAQLSTTKASHLMKTASDTIHSELSSMGLDKIPDFDYVNCKRLYGAGFYYAVISVSEAPTADDLLKCAWRSIENVRDKAIKEALLEK